MFRLTLSKLMMAVTQIALTTLMVLPSAQAQSCSSGTKSADSVFPGLSICTDYLDSFVCDSPAVSAASCPKSSVASCNQASTSMITNWYSASPLQADELQALQMSCVGGTWSSQTSTPTATTALPAPPASQSTYSASNGQLPEAAVQVQASGTYGNAKLSVTLNVDKATRSNRGTTSYNVYIVALVPGRLVGSTTSVMYVKPRAPANWKQLQWPMAEFMSNVTQSAINNQVIVEILDNMNVIDLIGTEIYIGYGTSDQEMLSANRFRGVYKVQ